MNEMLNSFQRLPRHCEILSGGRAPGCWRRDLLRLTERLNQIRQTGGWVQEFLGIDLSLSDQPLFGYGLAAFANKTANLAPTPARRPSSRAPNDQPTRAFERGSSSGTTTQHPIRPSTHEMPASKRAARIPPASASASALGQLQLQASASLLHRLAGERSNSISETKPRQKTIPEQPKQKSPSTPNFLPEEMSSSGLVELVTRRFDKAWRRNSAQMATAISGVMTSRSPSLAENWSMPVNGVRASDDYLAQLSAARKLRGRAGSETSPETFKGTTTDSPPDKVSASRREHTSGLLTNRERERPTDWPLDRAAPISPSLGDLGQVPTGRNGEKTRSSTSSESSTPAARDEGAWQASEDIAPPTLTPSLIPLRPPPAPGLAPLPIAAATAERSARQDERAAMDEDLVRLAMQIERILNEDARRHGVDV